MGNRLHILMVIWRREVDAAFMAALVEDVPLTVLSSRVAFYRGRMVYQ